MKRWIALVLSLSMVLSLAACSGGTDASGSAATASTSTDTTVHATAADVVKNFDVGIDSDLGDLSPFGASSTGRTYSKYAIYENLLQFSAFGQTVDEMERMIAKTVTVVDDLTAEVEIYDYVQDAAGNPITAQDIKFCYDMCAESGNYPQLTTKMASCEITGDYTLTFKFNSADVGTMEYVLGQVPIVSQKAYEESGDGMLSTPISTAPYQVKELSAGSYLVLEKNQNYWQTDESLRTHFATQEFDQITFNVIKESSQMSIGLETGAIDAATSVSGSEIDRFMNEDGTPVDGYNVMSSYGGLTTWMGLNTTDQSPLADENLRLAVMYGIDAQAIVDGALNGKGRTVGTLGTPTSPDYKEEWEDTYFSYDLEKAKEYFAQSGYNGGEVTLRIMTQNTTAHNRAAEIIQAYLSQLGINCEILAYDSALFNTYKGDPSQWDIKIDQGGTSDYVVTTMYTALNSGSRDWIVDPELNDLLDAGMAMETYGEQSTQALHDHLMEEAYVRGIYVTDSYTVSIDCIEMVRHPWGQLMAGACHVTEQ